MTTMKSISTQILTGVLLAVGTSALWAEVKVSQEITAGVQGVTQNNPEAKFEEYRDVPKGIVIDKYSITEESDKYDMKFQVKNVQQSDQAAELGFRAGKLDLGLSYDMLPHRWSNVSQTLYSESSPGVLLLPDGMQAQIRALTSGSAATARTNWYNVMQSTFSGLAHTQELETHQAKAGANLGFALSDALKIKMGFFQEKKDGHKLQAFAFGRNSAVELARPIDQTVYDSSLKLVYDTKKLTMGLGYGLNLYHNDISSLIWDNTKRDSDQFITNNDPEGRNSKQGQAALQPDNMAHTASLTAGLDVTNKVRVDADVAYTRMLQNDVLLPYTINTKLNASTATVGFNAYDSSTLPSEGAETDQTLWVQNYSLTTRPLKSATIRFGVRSEQLGNNSKEIVFAGAAICDQQWSVRSASNDTETERFAYRKLAFGANADIQPLSVLGLGADVTQESAHRTLREYGKTVETTITGRANYKPTSWASVRGRYINADRVASEFEIEDYMIGGSTWTFAELPGMRRMDLGSRRRNMGDAAVQAWTGPFNISLQGALGYDQYRLGEGPTSNPFVAVSTSNQNKQYGLMENRIARAGADISWDISDFLGWSAYYEYEHVRGVQRGNASGNPSNQDTFNDWTAVTTDCYDTGGTSIELSPVQKILLTLGYDLSHSRGATDLQELGATLATKQNPPETKTTKQDYSIKCDFHARSNVTISAGYLFEKYDVVDFATQNIPLVGSQDTTGAVPQTNIFLADSLMSYKAHVANLKFNYKW